jgi:hypothetical protein
VKTPKRPRVSLMIRLVISRDLRTQTMNIDT